MSDEQHERGPSPRDAYSTKWASHVDSLSRRRIQREVYGNEYPAEENPRSHVTWTELRRIVRELRIGPGDTFLDLGCGHGGPCLWIAHEIRTAVWGLICPTLSQNLCGDS